MEFIGYGILFVIGIWLAPIVITFGLAIIAMVLGGISQLFGGSK